MIKTILALTSQLVITRAHDASQCRENHILDQDCCASKTTGTCAEGYVQKWGDPYSCETANEKMFQYYCSPEEGTLVSQVIQDSHDASRCTPGSNCCEAMDQNKCQGGYLTVWGDKCQTIEGSVKYNYYCISTDMDNKMTQGILDNQD